MSRSSSRCKTWAALLFSMTLAIMAAGVTGAVRNDLLVAGLAGVSVLCLIAFKWIGEFSSIYFAVMTVGVSGMVVVACLPGAWCVAGVPFLVFALVATRFLERKGWDRA